MRKILLFIVITFFFALLIAPKFSFAQLFEPTCFDKTSSEWTALGYNVSVGTDLNNTLSGTAANDVLFGLGGNDTLNGNGGHDVICGGDGVDRINGGDGNDKIQGDAGNDIVDGYTGDDTLFGGDGDDQLSGKQGNDLIHGGLGNDQIYAGDGDDVVVGGAGVDKIEGGAGKNILSGGEDNDDITGYTHDDILFGGAGNDILRGKSAVDILDGGAGDDTLYGEDANDTIIGQEGADKAYGGSGADNIIGDCFPVESILSAEQTTRLENAAGVLGAIHDPTCALQGNDTLNGDASVDIIVGDSARVAPVGTEPVVYPTHGPEIICGTCVDYPNDVTVLILGNTYEMYGDGADTISGGNGGGGEVLNTPERFYGNGGNDTITDPDGDEYYYGGAGDDTLIAGLGTDYLYGGEGIDYCDGGLSNQGVLVDAGWDCETRVGLELPIQPTPTPTEVPTPTPTTDPSITPTPTEEPTPTPTPGEYTVEILEPANNYQLPQYTLTKISINSSAVAATINVYFDTTQIRTCNTTTDCVFWYNPNTTPGSHTLSTEAFYTGGGYATDSITVIK